jgi:hypothetical protein
MGTVGGLSNGTYIPIPIFHETVGVFYYSFMEQLGLSCSAKYPSPFLGTVGIPALKYLHPPCVEYVTHLLWDSWGICGIYITHLP